VKLSIVLHAHKDAEIVQDTIDSYEKYGTENILVAVDGVSPEWASKISKPHFIGFRNQTYLLGKSHSSYRNFTLGMMKLFKQFPDCDWYCSSEYDVIFGSDAFKKELNTVPKQTWCVGFNFKRTKMNLPLFEAITKKPMPIQNYLIGCCMFFKREFIEKMYNENVFHNILNYTNGFDHGSFPGYSEQGGYDFTECLFPTLVGYMGGGIRNLSDWNSKHKLWRGNHVTYPVRWPELVTIQEGKEASILHPCKNYDDPIRIYHREKRRAYG